MSDSGTVFLVGAGPGDPGLITVRGRECLTEADVVVYDSLANPALLDHAAPAAELIYVGKQASCHAMKQDDINQLLVDKAKEGNRVVRLKGGDPFVFGRGGEEALILLDAGVPFEIVPGVTAGVGAAAYAGIPVTYREHNSVLTFVTGHERPGKEESGIDWKALATGGGTLVFYMGKKNLPTIVERLVAEGRPGTTPVAVIYRGTWPVQRVVEGTLKDIVGRVEESGLTPPVIILVGKVASLRDRLKWFENRPLFGKTILVTRSRTQASVLAKKLHNLGATALCFPTIRMEPPVDTAPLADAISRLTGFDWVVFTSPNGVDGFFRVLGHQGLDARALSGCSVCAIGAGTAARLQENGVKPDMIPRKYTSAGIYDALIAADEVDGKSFLLPRTDIAPVEFPEKLTSAGGTVEDVVAYRTLPAEPEEAGLNALKNGTVDVVTFTSSSTAHNFAAVMRDSLGKVPTDVDYVSIGPETTKAALAEGLDISSEAEQHDIDGLVQVLVQQLTRS